MEQTGRNAASRIFHAKSDKGTIAAWRSDLDRILHVFNVRSTGYAVWLLLSVVCSGSRLSSR